MVPAPIRCPRRRSSPWIRTIFSPLTRRFDSLSALYHDRAEEKSVPDGFPVDSLPQIYRDAMEGVAARSFTNGSIQQASCLARCSISTIFQSCTRIAMMSPSSLM